MSSQPNSVKPIVDSIGKDSLSNPYPPLPQHQIIIATTLAYLIPGAGHIYLGRWQRGFAFFLSIYAMFTLGIVLHGHLYGFNIEPGAGRLSLLLTFADAGTGLAYYLLYALHAFAGISISFGAHQAEAPTYEYANTFLWTAGLLNYLVTMDAYDIADGRKK
ncbi:MAG: hypothetical protein HY819_18375 [Acidobacteria bacterium]|nr:hypothetical protein [Acidobacteriota bacterium]